MPQAALRRDHTAHTAADLDLTHPVDGGISRIAPGRVTATLAIFDPGER